MKIKKRSKRDTLISIKIVVTVVVDFLRCRKIHCDVYFYTTVNFNMLL